MFMVRLRSSVIVMTLTILLVVLGGDVLFTAMGIISLIGMTELYRIVKINKTLLGILGYLAGISYYLILYFDLMEHAVMLFILFLLLLMMLYVLQFPKYNTEQAAIAFLGLFYVSVMLSYIYQVRILEDGAWLVWLIFIGAWGSDTCAYLVGILIGKHKVTPKLSPKKSLEGCIGGVLGAALIGFLYATAVRSYLTGIDHPQLLFAVIGAASSVLSQIGDLAASAIKRDHEIKDYGKLIPGHGGILDRFDSIIFTAPIVYYLTVMLCS